MRAEPGTVPLRKLQARKTGWSDQKDARPLEKKDDQDHTLGWGADAIPVRPQRDPKGMFKWRGAFEAHVCALGEGEGGPSIAVPQ